MQEEFKLYLEAQGFTHNTVNDYLKRLTRILVEEKLSIDTLAKNIVKVLPEYENKDGKRAQDAKRSHFSVLASIRHFNNFLNTKNVSDEKN